MKFLPLFVIYIWNHKGTTKYENGGQKMKTSKKVLAVLLTIATLIGIFSCATPVLAVEVTEIAESQTSESTSETSENEETEKTEEEETNEPEILNEMVEWRTESTKYFRNSDGSYTAAQYSFPVHYEDNGEWKEIDNTLTEKAVKGKLLGTENEFVANKTNTPISFPDEFKRDSSKEITVSTDGYEISFSPKTELNIFKNAEGAIKDKTELKSVKIAEKFNEKQSGKISVSKELTTIEKAKIKEETSATAELEAIEETKSSETKKNDRNEKFKVENKSSAVVYENVFNDANLEYEVNNNQIKESIVLNEKQKEYIFNFNMDLGGLYPVVCPNGSVNLCSDKAGENPIAKIEAPYMLDSIGEYSDLVEMTIEPNGEEYILTVIADENWINDKARVFPVVIDPTIRLDINAAHTYDCYVDDSNPNQALPYDNCLYVGNNSYGKTQTFVKFDLPNLPGNNYLITGASIVYYQYEIDPGNGSTEFMTIHKLTEDWDNEDYDVTWNQKPYFDENLVLDYAKFYGANDGNLYPYEFDVTRTVKAWYEGAPNYGFALKLKDENATKRARLVSAEHPVDNYYPSIYVTFLDNKGLESYWSYSSYSIGSAGNAYINDYTGNLVYELPILSSISERAPLTLTAYFNNYCATQPLTAGKSNSSRTTIGKGFRLNIQQTVLPSTKYGLSGENAQKYPYVYTDADGTEHFLVKETEEGKTVYKDEEGLGLTMTTDCDIVATYQITDKAHNNYYFNSEGNLGIMQDKNGNQITIDFVAATDSDNFRSKTRISKITDGVGHTFTFHYYDTTTGNYVDYIKDDAGRKVEFKIEDGYLKSVTYPDATKSIIGYEYEYGGTQSDEGLINFINDNGVYGLNFDYSPKSTGRMVKKVKEFCSPSYNSNTEKYESFKSGQEVTFDRSQYNTTVIRTCGMDGTHGNNDDILTTLQFDNTGRPTSQQVRLGNGTHSVAGAYNYTSESSSLASQNKISSSAGLGKNTVNYVKNSNAETEATWNNSKSETATGSVAYNASQAYIGEKSIRLHTSSIGGKGDGVWAYQDITGLTGGKTYTLSAYVKVTAFGEYKNHDYLGASIAIASRDSANNKTVFSESLTEVTSTAVDNGWRRLSVKITMPSDSTEARIYLELRSFVGTAYFDCIQFEYGTTENSYNLLENSSFEKYNSDDMPTGWTTFGMTSADKIVSESINGSRGFKIKGEPGVSKGLAQYPVVSGKPEDTYIVSGWAMANAVNSTYHYTIDDKKTEDKEDDKRIDTALFEIEIKVYYDDGTEEGYAEEKPSAKFNTTIDGWQYTVQAFSLKSTKYPDYEPTQIRIMPRYNHQDNVAYFDYIQLIKDAAPSYTYDDEGNVIAVAENSEQKANAEYENNNLKSYTDVLNNETKLEYDDNNNLTITTSPKKVYGESFYNGVGNVTAQETRSAKSSENASLVIRTETDYTEAGNGLKTNAYVKSTSDEHGNETTYTYDWATGKPKTVTNAKDTVTTYGYDEDYNRLIRVTADQSKVFYEYSGNQLDHIHFASTGGGVKENYYFNYDSYGNVKQTKVGTATLSTNTYAANNGALISTEYGTGDKIENKYDELGNLKKVIATPDGKSSKEKYTWAYNSAGVTTIHRDYENGRRYFYRYDSLGRLITQEIRSNEDVNHTHIGSIGYEYDLRNNLTKLGIEIGNRNVPQQTYYYGEAGVDGSANAGKDNLLTRYQLTSSRYIDYKYDALNRLQYKKISTTTPFLIDYEYKSSKRNSGNVEKYKTTQLASEKLDDVTYSYTYDDVGNITAVKRKGADYRSYEYDALSQLTRENNKSGTQFTKVWNYDALGNIESVKVYPYTTGTINADTVFPSAIDYVYDSDSETGWNRLLKEVRYKTYNANGNEITDKRVTKTIDYDGIGNPIKYLDYKMSWFGRQLEEIKAGTDTTDTTADDKTISFTYGADGLRGTKTVTDSSGTVTSEFVYANGQLAYEKRGDSELYFFYDGLGHLAAIRYYEDASEDTYKQYYVATNSMGDVLNIINGDGNIIAKYAYDAWGNVVSIVDCDFKDDEGNIIEKNITNDTTSTDIAMVNPIRYRGYYLDRETGFYYLQSRYYDPSIGRFINADTIDVLGVSPTGLTDKNLFSYCDNNPVTRKDIQGNAWETVFDVISLGMSIADVAVNPTNPWAWAGLVGDVVDVAIPFVGGVGEVIKCCGTINKVSGVIDAANDTKKFVSKSVGTYEIMYKSGKNYVGKGTFNRAIQSAKRYTAPHSLNNGLGDEVLSITWKKAANNKEAFITEYLWQHRKNGVLSSNSSAKTYNVIWSPGRMLLGWF